MKQIVFFFRQSSPVYHSIEKLFTTIIEHLPEKSVFTHYAPFQSKGLVNRIRIGLDARKKQGIVNHITGDIHFIALFLERRKTILTIHDLGSMTSGNIFKRLIIRFWWFYLPVKCVRKITVISEFTRNELLKEIKINPQKVLVIPNCYPSVYKSIAKTNKEDKPVILQIGTKINKNLERLILAIKSFNCKLLIVGKLNKDQLQLLIDCKTDFENFENISQNEMFGLYQRCDILAYISTYEGFGMPVIEANVVGRSVIASNIEPVKTVADNAALLVDPFNVDAIRDAIIRLLNDDEYCNQLIENGFENARKYHPSVIARQYMDIYEEILNEK